MPAKQVKIRRGTTAEHSIFTGKQGEITVDLDKDTLIIHDESTAGGHPLAKEDMTNVVGQVGLPQLKLSNNGSAGQFLSTDGNGNLLFAIAGGGGTAVGGDLSGTVSNAQIVSNAILTDKIADDAVTEQKIADDAVTESKIADDAVGTSQIITGSIVDSKLNTSGTLPAWDGSQLINLPSALSENSVTTTELANDAVETLNIKDGNVTSDKIADDAVTNNKIANDAVTVSKIADNAVTETKIANNAITTPKFATSGTLPAWDGSQLTNLPSTSGWVESQGQNSAGGVEFDDVSEVDILYTPSFQGGSVGTDGLDHSWTRIMFYDLSYNSGAAVGQPLGLQILNNSGGTNAVGSYNYITHDIYGSSDGTTANHTAIKTDSLSSNGSQIIMNAFGGSTQSTGWVGGGNEDTSLIIDIPNSGGKLKSKMIHTRYWHGGNSGTGGSGPHMVDTLAKADQGPNGYQIHGVRIFSVGSSTTNNLTGKYVVLKTIPASGNPF